ncbi:Beige/BEACH domain containing protein [Trichomonas vaginalis G3]|uniref:Beige/BEACH domain containing protein n=1 Tax=Trichomonas vaginalis (strain ATCC PRA-98 / G3) TaxID=412133 RepID=A2EXR2_TRIV3|nr:beige/BEACH-related family [Trichomonas vaginalis G3]EAY02572.1 Beige/BEACH domain containing protein [Trichomonas vaginalis G3]KAI5552037.1 beige/BEACH-related family [Trichomonas vaginalis G3]|eukprot:XP_001330708.1 Beige/BEACH domain containing protein [Trichomonas vaginalis G3]
MSKSANIVSSLLPLLKILISLVKSKPCFVTNQIPLMTTMFYNLYSAYLNNIPLILFQDFLDCLRDFYTAEIKNFPLKAYDLLPECIHAIKKSNKNGAKISSESLYAVIGILCEEHPHTFPKTDAETILSLISPSIAQLEISELSLFSHLSPLLSMECIHDILTALSKSIIPYLITQQTTLKFPSKGVDREQKPPIYYHEVTFQIHEAKTFPNGINLRPNITLPPKTNFEDLLSNEIHTRLSLLLRAAKLDTIFFSYFVTEATNFVKKGQNIDHLPLVIMSLLFFATHFSVINLEEPFFEFFSLTQVFDGKYTIFDDIEDFGCLDAARNAVVELIIKSANYNSPSFMACAQYPLLFQELMHRIIRDLQFINTDNLLPLIKFIMPASLYFQDLDTQSDDCCPEIEGARAALFLLMSHVLGYDGCGQKLFSNNYFSTFFLSFMFEDAPREYALTNLRLFMSDNNNPIPPELLSILTHVLNVCFSNFQCEAYLVIIYDMLQTLNEVLKHKRSSTQLFEKFRSSFFPSMSKLTTLALSQKVLLQYIQFFALTSSYKLLNNAQLQALENCICRVFNSTLPQTLWVKLIQLVATDITPSLNPSFYIRQPDAIKLMLKISQETDKFLEVLQFINNLVKFSPANRTACYDHDVDLYIIAMIKKLKNPPIEIVNALLLIFQSVAVLCSSSTVVQRFVSLFAPIRGKYIPQHINLYMQILNQIVQTTMKLPVMWMRMTKDSASLEVQGLTAKHFEDGFSIAFWAFIDSAQAQYKPIIAQFTDTHNRKLTWFFSATSLFFTQRSETYESTGRVEMDDIPKQHWNFFILTYKTDKDQSVMETIINCKKVEPLEFQPMKFHDGPVSCTIGGVLPDSAETDQFSRIGTFAMFPVLSDNHGSILYEVGPRLMNDTMPLKPIFYCKIFDDLSRIGVMTINTDESIKVSLSKKNVRATPNFLGALINLCKVEILIPLFSELDMLTEDKQKIPDFQRQVLECFSNIFASSENAQKSFHWGRGFAIISHLLLEADRSNIRYSLYKQFYAMMQSITFPVLQNEIMSDILLNVDIWSRCDDEGHLLVLRHWARNLLLSYKSIVVEVLPFKRILSILRLYYWYEPTENPQILGIENRQMSLNITEARRLLQFIALNVATIHLTVDDIRCLQSHCITCCDNNQVADYLWMLCQLGMSNPSPLENLKNVIDLTSFIFALFTRNDPKIYRFAMNIFVVFARRKLTPPENLPQQIFQIIHTLQPNNMTPWLFEKVMEMINDGLFELVPVAFVFARQNDNLEVLFNAVKPDPSIAYHFSWALWPLYVSRYTSNEETIKTIEFVTQCSMNSLGSVFSTIDFIENVLNEDLSSMKRQFLITVADIILKNSSQENTNTNNSMSSQNSFNTNNSMSSINENVVKLFLKLSRYYLLFRSMCEKNDYLETLYEESPFYEPRIQHPPPKRSPSAQHIITYDTFSNQIKHMSRTVSSQQINDPDLPELPPFIRSTSGSFENPKASEFLDQIEKMSQYRSFSVFGLRFDPEGNWLDQDLAQKVTEVFLKYRYSEFLMADLIICSFLLHSKPDVAITHAHNIKIKDDEKEKISNVVCLLNNHMNKCNQKQQTMITCEKCIENSFTHTARIRPLLDQSIVQMICSTSVDYCTLVSQNSQKMISGSSYMTDDFIGESLVSVGSVIDDIAFQRRENVRRWNTLWRYLSVERAPWSFLSPDQSHFKRDNTACLLFCPFKLKRNLHFYNNEIKVRRDSMSVPLKLFEVSGRINDEIDTPNEDKSQIFFETQCVVISPSNERDAQFVLTKKYLKLNFLDKKKWYPLNTIIHLFFRRRFHKPNSIEVFFDSGKNYFIYFPYDNSLDILQKMSELNLPNVKTLQTKPFQVFFQSSQMTNKWLENRVSNFEYLMHLNIMSGRTFNDLTQYPILPWVFSDFIDPSFSLDKPEKYRDLNKPLGVMNKERLTEIFKKMSEQHEAGEAISMYQSAPLNEPSVCNYLQRIEPFTSMNNDIQKSLFDNSDPIFMSISETYEQVTHNLNDYRELTPEFFGMPEFLFNNQAKKPNDDVELPKWSKNATEFVYLHRKILESPKVTENLHHWIDLIWGVRQKSNSDGFPENIYSQEMYEDIWSTEKSEEETQKIQSVLEYNGQIPPQLFTSPHPQRTFSIDPQYTFTSPCGFNIPLSGEVLLSRIDPMTGQNGLLINAKISVLDANGTIFTATVDFSQYMRINGNHPKPRHSHSGPTKSSSSNLTEIPTVKPKSDKPKTDKKLMPVSTPSIGSLRSYDVGNIDMEHVTITTKSVKNLPQITTKKTSNMWSNIRQSSIACISPITGRVYIVDMTTGNVDKMNALHNDAVCLDSDRNYIAVALTDTALCVFRLDNLVLPIVVMPSYRYSIECCAVSASYYLVVMGTRDGSLIINSLNNGGTVRSIDLHGCRPRHVIITHSWAFIVVYMTEMVEGSEAHFISVYNVNGEFIRKTQIDSAIVAWDTWISPQGFDYIVFVDHKGRLFSFEVFFLNIEKPFFRFWKPVSSVKFLGDISTVAVVTTDGLITFIPNMIQ